MATHSQALKRHRQSVKRRERNRHYLSAMRTLIKRVRVAVAEGRKDDAVKALAVAQRHVDKVAGKGVIDKKAGGRYVSRLTAQVHALVAHQ